MKLIKSLSLLCFLCLFAFGAFVYVRHTNSNNSFLERVKSWNMYHIEKSNTRLWCLARAAAGDNYDTRDIVAMIAEKNNLGQNYDLRPGDKILLPVMDK